MLKRILKKSVDAEALVVDIILKNGDRNKIFIDDMFLVSKEGTIYKKESAKAIFDNIRNKCKFYIHSFKTIDGGFISVDEIRSYHQIKVFKRKRFFDIVQMGLFFKTYQIYSLNLLN